MLDGMNSLTLGFKDINFLIRETTGFSEFGGVFCRFVGGESFVFQGTFFIQESREFSYCKIPAFPSANLVTQLQISADAVAWSDPYNVTVVGKKQFNDMTMCSFSIICP